MVAEDVTSRMAEQLDVVVEKAREIFVDLLEESAREAKIGIGPISESDKRCMERLFSEVVYSHIIAEAAAIVSFLIHEQLKDDDVLKHVVPAFLDLCEGKMEKVPDGLARKTSNLTKLAKDVLDSSAGKGKSAIVVALLAELAEMSQMKHLRATFDATSLSFLGE
jgi:energy-converting hydrogenase A subunit M